MLRPYQESAFDAAKDWIKNSTDPAVIEAATGAGKSHIIAVIAEWVNVISKGKSILVLQPSAELVTQNREKFLLTGMPASILSASAGGKCVRHSVIFATPITANNALARLNDRIALVLIDEAHGITNTVRNIIDKLREKRPMLRVIGLTGTPYRMGDGYIYSMTQDNKTMPETKARDPYFKKLIYRITAKELISAGYLTPVVIGDINESYDTSGLVKDNKGSFTTDSLDRAFVGKGRLTAHIVADVIARSASRMGVMFFAATIQHAQEILESLPPTMSAIVTGDTKTKERREIIQAFKDRRIKYLVNVSVLTTGFDAPHVDVIAMLRRTESAGLLQQIIGRSLRLHEHKDDALLLDYAGNVETHFPNGDVFEPDIKASFKDGESVCADVVCPQCHGTNEFKSRPNPDGYNINENGEFLDLDGQRILVDGVPMPSHYGRRCYQQVKIGMTYEQCNYRWSMKQCEECSHENDIAARYCEKCKSELVNPNEKLSLAFARFKANPRNVQTDNLLNISAIPWSGNSGKGSVKITVTTPWRTFSYWLSTEIKAANAVRRLGALVKVVGHCHGNEDIIRKVKSGLIKTVTYQKDGDFYEALSYNNEVDEAPTNEDT